MTRYADARRVKFAVLAALCTMIAACGQCGSENNSDNGTDPEPCVGEDCAEVVSAGIVVQAAQARSCELLLEEQSSSLSAIAFADGTTGAMRKQAPKVAVAFARDSDEAFSGDFATLSVAGEVSGLVLSSVVCRDAAGQVIADPGVSLR